MNGFPREIRNEVRNFARFRLSWKTPLTRPSATLSPTGGEGRVRGRFMGSLLAFFRMHWDHEPDWHPSPCPLPAKRGEGGRRPGEGRFMERFPRKISRIEPLNLVGTARCAVRAAFSGATMPPAASRAGTSQRDVPTKVRFMESPFRFSHALGP